MVDIETLGNDPKTGPMIGIGATIFTMEEDVPYPDEEAFIHSNVRQHFFRPIQLLGQYESHGFIIDEDTLLWWLSDEHKKEMLWSLLNSPKAVSIKDALLEFGVWVGEQTNGDDRYIWSHGATYDYVHLETKVGIVLRQSLTTIFPFRNVRDTRTLFDVFTARYPGLSVWPDRKSVV